MRLLLLITLGSIAFSGCKKNDGPRVDIYLLASFSNTINNSTNPASILITNTVLESSPLVKDKDILYYDSSTHRFKLKIDIQTLIKGYTGATGYAVTIDKEPIYYGTFQPVYSSYLPLGHSLIMPMVLTRDELKIDFPMVTGSTDLQALDKRNDPRLIQALKKSGRLR